MEAFIITVVGGFVLSERGEFFFFRVYAALANDVVSQRPNRTGRQGFSSALQINSLRQSFRICNSLVAAHG